MPVINELKRIWKESFVALEVLSCHLPGGTEKNHKNLRIANLWAKI
jgi:hypothetical protein